MTRLADLCFGVKRYLILFNNCIKAKSLRNGTAKWGYSVIENIMKNPN